jgi:SAM-dependent methyltransferase
MNPRDKKSYKSIIAHYEDCLEKFGDTHLGVDWPDKDDAETRYKVMLEVIRNTSKRQSLLDFGCGASHLYEYMLLNELDHVEYSGLDLSERFIQLSKSKFPDVNYYCLDILDDAAGLPDFDYIVMNGVFTEKQLLSFDEMFAYFKRMISQVFVKAKVGLAFNVMSSHVDWEREDLFHLPMDKLADFLVRNVSRDFIIRNDYQLYEYTVYVYRR